MHVPFSSPLYFFASARRGPTLDQGEGGGNPFASALVDLLGSHDLTLRRLRAGLAKLTWHKSGGIQRPELPGLAGLPPWRILPTPVQEARRALVLVFSDYTPSGGTLHSLPGAAHDAQRVAAALGGAGFVTDVRVDPSRASLRRILRSFGASSAAGEAAVLYTTGHGVDVAGAVYLLPGDYPMQQGAAALVSRAIPLATMAESARATRINLVFYGGCRVDPFAAP